MKKICVISLCFVLLLNLTGGFKANALENPDINAKAAVFMEKGGKRVLYQKNAHVKLPMASTTKIMTALVAIENGNLSEVITIPPEASGVEGSSIWLSPGEKHTLEDLLYGLMLSSGNDAAVAVALHIGGSVENFAAMMNARAKELGAMDTNFVTPHGLHDDNHYTTAYDLALISSVAMENPKFAEIVNTRNKTIPWEGSKWDRALRNKNKIIWQYDGGNGIKTGYTSNAGRCLVSAALREEMQVVGVVLNCPDMFEDSKKMLDYCFDTYDMTTVYNKDDSFGKVPVEGATVKEVEFLADVSVALPLTDEEKSSVYTEVKMNENLVAPIKAGDEIGEVNIFVGGNMIASAKLKATKNVVKNSLKYNIMRIITKWNDVL
ncbi:MAG: D-alanyl-D-alanine carboxypeptidase [Clostridia bacterium]|nr:D-alanyl-D-alanine carboxypeptidase [Clostridia bacterium]